MEEKKVVVSRNMPIEAPSELVKQLDEAKEILGAARMAVVLKSLKFILDKKEDLKVEADEERGTFSTENHQEVLHEMLTEISIYSAFLEIYDGLKQRL